MVNRLTWPIKWLWQIPLPPVLTVLRKLLGVPEPFAENSHNNVEPPIRGQILEWLADDPLLQKMMEYRFDDPDANARQIANALKIQAKDVYNANRRLKDRLNRMKHKEDETV